MTDIRIEVDLRHPARRVWLALTDPRLLAQWFAETQPTIAAGARFRMHPVDLPDLDATITGEVLEFDEPHRLVMRWGGPVRRTVVACDLSATPDGCRLAFLEFPEAGTWRPEERDRREAAYQQSIVGRLPAVLDWLAFREVEFTTAAAPTQDPGPEPGPGPRSGQHTPSRSPAVRRRLAVAGAFLLVPAVALTVVLTLRDGEAPVTATPDHSPSGALSATPPPATLPPSRPPARATRAAGAPTATSRRPTAGGAAGSSGPGRAAMEATYDTLTSRLFGYTGEVVVANGGTATARTWTVTISLPDGASLADASGVQFRQDGQEVTFTGPAVAAGATLRFEFEVADARLGPKRPAGCTIDGKPCAGL